MASNIGGLMTSLTETLIETRRPRCLGARLQQGVCEKGGETVRGRLGGGSRRVACSASSPEATISVVRRLQSPVATVHAAPVARVSAASPVVSYLFSSHSPSSSSLTVCDCL
ncbi:unnamed protein product [Closterium sp. NIES-54]